MPLTTSGPDGMLTALVNQYHALAAEGVDQMLLTQVPTTRHGLEDLDVRSVPSVPLPFVLQDAALCLPAGVARMFSDKPPDILHLHLTEWLCLMASVYAKRRRLPRVVTYHSHQEAWGRIYGIGALMPLLARYLRWFYAACDVLVVPSKRHRQRLISEGLCNTVYIPNGVDTVAFNPANRSRAWRDEVGVGDRFLVACFGRLAKEKDLRVMVPLYEALERKGRVRVVFVGEGPELPWLQRHLPDAIFIDTLAGAPLRVAVASSDAILLPSLDLEVGPNVLLESFASGVPVVGIFSGAARGRRGWC